MTMRGAKGAARLLGQKPRDFKYFDSSRPTDQRRRKTRMPRATFCVSELKDQHHEIIRRLLLGQKSTFIAEQLGVSTAMVNYTKNSPVVQERLQFLRTARDAKVIDVAAHIKRVAPKSIQLLEQVIEGKGEGADAPISLRCRVAMDNLDRAGHTPVKKFQGAVSHFTSDDIAELKNEALKRVGQDAIEVSSNS